MLKSGRKSMQQQPASTTEVPDIAAHHDYVDELLEWSINDFDHLISIFQHRIKAEEIYVNALAQIKQLPPPPTMDVLPFEGELTFATAKNKYMANLDRIIVERSHLAETMANQLDVLLILKTDQEKKRGRIRTSLRKHNNEYMKHREKVLQEQRKTYMAKHAELEQEENASNNDHAATATATAATPAAGAEGAAAATNEEGRNSSESVTTTEKTEKRKSRAALQSIRQHLSTKTTQADHNNKIAKLKHEVMETDRSYRNGVVTLERLREEQINTVKLVHENIEMMFMDKTEITKSVLRYVFATEQSVQTREASMLQALTKTCDDMDGRKDMAAFAQRMGILNFASPDPIYYEHFKHGQLKDAQFGTSLETYSKTHGGRAVPVLVTRCIEAVEEMGGLEREGIYRISGRYASVDALRLEFEKDEQLCDLKQFDLFTVSSVLKVYLRELELPLWSFPMSLRDEYSRKDETTRLRELEIRIGKLTTPYRETLQVITEHLARIGAQAVKNKMTILNLSYIFTPAIFHDEQQSQTGPDNVLVDLITHHKLLFVKDAGGDNKSLPQEHLTVQTATTNSNSTNNTMMTDRVSITVEEPQLPRPSVDSSNMKKAEVLVVPDAPVPKDRPSS